jgi:hypothetical protein
MDVAMVEGQGMRISLNVMNVHFRNIVLLRVDIYE